MSSRQGVQGKPIPPGIMSRVMQSLGGLARNFADGWFGPGQPAADAVPPGAERRFAYQPGYNIAQTPRSDEAISFEQLRSLANLQDIVRLAIETRKDQMEKLEHSFRPRRKRGEKRADVAARAGDPRIDELTNFFEAPGRALYYPPDGGPPEIVPMKWNGWLRSMLEDVLVIDAPAVAIRRNLAGTPFSLDVIDGATVKPLLDQYGSITSYQQYVYGVPGKVVGPGDLAYQPRNPRSNRVYGFSPVEQIVTTINIMLRRTAMQMSFYTNGNIPEGFMRAPEGWSTETLESFQANFDAYMMGNPATRSKLIVLPNGGSDPIFPKRDSLKTEEDEWWTRIAMFAFSLSPQALIQQMNRATAETAKEAAAEEGLEPLMLFVTAFVNMLIRVGWGPEYADEIEFAFEFQKELNPVELATLHKEYISCAVLSINEARDDLGMDPIEGGDVHGFIGATGFTPLERALQPPAPPPQLQLPPGTPPDPGADPSADPSDDPATEKKLATMYVRMRRAAKRIEKRQQYGRRAPDQG